MTEAYRPGQNTAASRAFSESSLQKPTDLDGVEIISGRANPDLARSIGGSLGIEVDDRAVGSFSDGELKIKINPNLRKKEVYLVQPTSRAEDRSVSDHVMEVLLLASAAKLASSGEITAVIPYYGMARQDRKDQPRVPISAAHIAQLMVHSGVDRIFTLDLHAEQTMGSISPHPWDNLYGSGVLLPAVRELELENPVVASADVGGAKKAQKFSLSLDGSGEIAIVNKNRKGADVKANAVIGDVDGRDVVVVDDMIDTAGTLLTATRLIKDEGAKRIIVLATHGVLSGRALENIEKAPIDQVLITDTISQPDEVRQHPKIRIVTVAGLLAEGIKRIHTGESLSELIPQAS